MYKAHGLPWARGWQKKMLGSYDVTIIGAGPAGTSAASRLAGLGYRVAIFDKFILPRVKPCAGGLVMRGLLHLPQNLELPVEKYCLETRVYVEGTDLCFHTKKPEPILAMTMRRDFDNALLGHAVSGGAKLIENCEVMEIQVKSKMVNLETARGRVTSRFAIAADGALSSMGRRLGLRPPLYLVPAIECEVRVSAKDFERFSSAARFHMGFVPQGYAWVFPKKEHLSVGLGRMRRGSLPLADYLDRYLAFLGLSHAHIIGKKASVISFYTEGRPFAIDRILLTGDAAGLADPLTAEGISGAVLSGQLAAKAIEDCDREKGDIAKHYESLLQAHMLKDIKLARKVAKWIYDYPSFMRLIFLLYGERICEGMMEVMSGQISYARLLANPITYMRPFRLGGKHTSRTKIDKRPPFR